MNLSIRIATCDTGPCQNPPMQSQCQAIGVSGAQEQHGIQPSGPIWCSVCIGVSVCTTYGVACMANNAFALLHTFILYCGETYLALVCCPLQHNSTGTSISVLQLAHRSAASTGISVLQSVPASVPECFGLPFVQCVSRLGSSPALAQLVHSSKTCLE